MEYALNWSGPREATGCQNIREQRDTMKQMGIAAERREKRGGQIVTVWRVLTPWGLRAALQRANMDLSQSQMAEYRQWFARFKWCSEVAGTSLPVHWFPKEYRGLDSITGYPVGFNRPAGQQGAAAPKRQSFRDAMRRTQGRPS